MSDRLIGGSAGAIGLRVRPPRFIGGEFGGRGAEAATGRNTQGVAFTPDGKYVVVQNYVEQELAMYRMTPTALEDTGVRIKVKGHPASLRVAPQ